LSTRPKITGEKFFLVYPLKTPSKKGTNMKNSSLLVPLFKKIDKVLFGIEDWNEIDKVAEGKNCENEEQFEEEHPCN
jgi:hypothetical protein